MNGFGSSLLRPKGRIVPSLEIQILSFLFLSKRALSELDWALIKSKIKQVIWSSLDKCLPTGLSGSLVLRLTSPMCSLNLMRKVLLVLPTYCLPQVLHCMRYITLWHAQQACCLLCSLRLVVNNYP